MNVNVYVVAWSGSLVELTIRQQRSLIEAGCDVGYLLSTAELVSGRGRS